MHVGAVPVSTHGGGDDLWVSETPKLHLRHGRPVRELWMST